MMRSMPHAMLEKIRGQCPIFRNIPRSIIQFNKNNKTGLFYAEYMVESIGKNARGMTCFICSHHLIYAPTQFPLLYVQPMCNIDVLH